MLKAQAKSHNKMVMENREQCVESDLNFEEVEIDNNLNKAKDNFKDLVKKSQEMRERELLELHLTEMNEETELNKKKKKEIISRMEK